MKSRFFIIWQKVWENAQIIKIIKLLNMRIFDFQYKMQKIVFKFDISQIKFLSSLQRIDNRLLKVLFYQFFTPWLMRKICRVDKDLDFFAAAIVSQSADKFSLGACWKCIFFLTNIHRFLQDRHIYAGKSFIKLIK